MIPLENIKAMLAAQNSYSRPCWIGGQSRIPNFGILRASTGIPTKWLLWWGCPHYEPGYSLLSQLHFDICFLAILFPRNAPNGIQKHRWKCILRLRFVFYSKACEFSIYVLNEKKNLKKDEQGRIRETYYIEDIGSKFRP